jgi:hypothetical protein
MPKNRSHPSKVRRIVARWARKRRTLKLQTTVKNGADDPMYGPAVCCKRFRQAGALLSVVRAATLQSFAASYYPLGFS